MNDYTTSDIYLSATLSALNYRLEEITQEDNKFVFHFYKTNIKEPSFAIALNADEYWAGNLLVDPKRLFSEFKEIKARMYDLRRRKKG